MTDLTAADHEWTGWIAQACAAVGVDPDVVDVSAVHELTRDIAHGFSRPMAPVAAFIWGVALGQGIAAPATNPSMDPALLRAAIAATADPAAIAAMADPAAIAAMADPAPPGR